MLLPERNQPAIINSESQTLLGAIRKYGLLDNMLSSSQFVISFLKAGNLAFKEITSLVLVLLFYSSICSVFVCDNHFQ